MHADVGRIEVHFDQELLEEVIFQNAWIRNYQVRSVDQWWFLSTCAGTWEILTEEEYRRLKSVAIPNALYEKLERNFLILTQANVQAYFERFRTWTTPHFRHPVHHIVITTLRCNLACTYCHADIRPPSAGREFDLTCETATKIVDFALNSKQPTQSFEFQGGESLLNGLALRFLIPEIRRRYADAGKQVFLSIQTNALLLNDDWYEFLNAHDVSIGTSLDGPSMSHNVNRVTVGGTPAYDVIREKAETYHLPMLPTIASNTAEHWQGIIDMQLEVGSSTVAFQPVYPINHAKKNWGEVGFAGDEFPKIYKKVVEYLRSQWREGYYPLERRFKLGLQKLLRSQDVDFADFGNPCGMVSSQIVYHTNGDIYTCDEGRDFAEFRLGNVATDSYADIVSGKRTRELRSLSLLNDPECQTCSYRPMCSTCPVYERAVTGELQASHYGTDNCRHTIYIFDTLVRWIATDAELMRRVAEYHGI